MKYSRQRELIYQTVLHNPIHPSADTVHALVRTQEPNISLGTVYRNLNLLCTHCGQVFDIPFQDLPGLEKQIHGIPDFTVTGYQLLVEGVCGNCMDNQDKKA